MKAVAEMTGAARAILESQRQTVDAILMRERTRFAYEIHDGLTQAVTTAVLELEALGHQIEQDPRGAALTLSTTKAEIRKSLSELRGLLYDLSREDRGPAVASEEPARQGSEICRPPCSRNCPSLRNTRSYARSSCHRYQAWSCYSRPSVRSRRSGSRCQRLIQLHLVRGYLADRWQNARHN